MKYFLLFFTLFYSFTHLASADALKNSLNNMLKKKDSTSMVNLGTIDFNAKPAKRERGAKAVIATVDNEKIIKRDADAYIAQRTQGKVSDFDNLPEEQQQRLVHEMALPMMILVKAQKDLSEKEKEAVYSRVWMKKEASKIVIADEEVLVTYNQLKQKYVENNNSMAIPSFDQIKPKLRLQMIEKIMVDNVMKDANIKIF